MEQTNKAPLGIILGPTASGKTSLGVQVAKRLGGEVISADSIQIYRGLDIGSAKPTREEMEGVPHHMLDVAEASPYLSAGGGGDGVVYFRPDQSAGFYRNPRG